MHYGIIAAGEGSRLAQEGALKPKPLIELNGVAMVERLIRIFESSGAESVSIIVNEQMHEVQEFVAALKTRLSIPLNIIVKSTPSSMHSFYELSRLMKGKGRFILTTVDTIFKEKPFKAYAKAFSEAASSIDGMMAMTSYIDDEKPLYIEVDDTDKIVSFRDQSWEGARYVSGGIYGLDQSAIAVLEDCMAQGVSRMRNFQRALISAGLHLQGYELEKILDVDHVGDIDKALAFINSK
jgi:NDP-sugar pyrophosphorylase family protein